MWNEEQKQRTMERFIDATYSNLEKCFDSWIGIYSTNNLEDAINGCHFAYSENCNEEFHLELANNYAQTNRFIALCSVKFPLEGEKVPVLIISFFDNDTDEGETHIAYGKKINPKFRKSRKQRWEFIFEKSK